MHKEIFHKHYKATINRLTIILALKFVKGDLFVKLVLKRIELKKRALLINLDGNQPILLDKELA